MGGHKITPESKMLDYIESQILKSKREIGIDLKDWRYVSDLINSIKEKPGAFKGKDILYIPEYRFNLYQANKSASALQKALIRYCTVDGKYPMVASKVSSKTYNVQGIIKKIYKEMENK